MEEAQATQRHVMEGEKDIDAYLAEYELPAAVGVHVKAAYDLVDINGQSVSQNPTPSRRLNVTPPITPPSLSYPLFPFFSFSHSPSFPVPVPFFSLLSFPLFSFKAMARYPFKSFPQP